MWTNRNSAFLDVLASGRILFLDGAMGTMLQAAGMPPGVGPEHFCLANPEILTGIHNSYLQAGSDIITTCTFGASRFKLAKGEDVFEINRQMARIARRALAESGREGPLFVAGDVGPSGLFAKPLGEIEPEELIDGFAEQIRGLAAGGVDLIFMETQFDLAEVRAAIIAARRVCDLPVIASMTFEHGVSLTGSTPEIFAETALNLGVSALGTNCSLGPVEMLPVVEELLRTATVPVLVEPNAGLPELRDGKTIFPLGPEDYAQKTAIFAKMGAQIIGGCCGTTPAHIRELKKAVLSLGEPERIWPQKSPGICLTSRSRVVRIGPEQPLVIIGERINPTGKPKLKAQLQAGDFTEAFRFSDEQIDNGAAVLDLNVGAPLVDETVLLPQLTCELVARHLAPLSLDSSNIEAIRKAIPYCPGSCLVNSISGEAGKMEALGPLCRDYGAPFVLLPLMGAKMPETAAERIAILEKLLLQAQALGIGKRLIIVDILALAISTSHTGAVECLKLASWCREHGFATNIGLSNISFGMPARELINSSFLAMAASHGLGACIANPCLARIREAVAAANVLLGKDRDAAFFIENFAQWKSGAGAVTAGKTETTAVKNLHDAVLKGDRESVASLVDMELAAGKAPFTLVNDVLIPAITEVGDLYEKRKYFLPQLIRSAETMQLAFAKLKPLLEESGGTGRKPVIVMATVEGDIHDIGKNIVSLLLGNHGFEVIDAGKDVPAEQIVDCAIRHNAVIIGLSALMTTTMVRMEDTIRLLKERNLPIKVIVGGAAVTQDFADSIGADAYCEDAVASVKAAKKFVAEMNLEPAA